MCVFVSLYLGVIQWYAFGGESGCVLGEWGGCHCFDVHLIQRKDDVFGVFDEFVL